MGSAKRWTLHRFAHSVGELVGVIGRADRAGPLRDRHIGLVLPGQRKTVEPIAAPTAMARTAAQHRFLAALRRSVPVVGCGGVDLRELVVPHLEAHGPIAAWIIDDTGILHAKSKHGGPTIARNPRFLIARCP